MSIHSSQRVSVPKDVLIRELDGELVLLNLNNECYYGLDQVGTRIWKALCAAESIEAAHHALLDEYDVKSDTLESDMQKLLSELGEHGLIKIEDASLA